MPELVQKGNNIYQRYTVLQVIKTTNKSSVPKNCAQTHKGSHKTPNREDDHIISKKPKKNAKSK